MTVKFISRRRRSALGWLLSAMGDRAGNAIIEFAVAMPVFLVAAVMGLAFTGGGLLATGWIRTGSVTGDMLGASIITALAIMFTWVSLFGEASGFSSSVGAAGVAVGTRGGVTVARVAFGIGAVLIGIVAGYAWWRLIRRLF